MLDAALLSVVVQVSKICHPLIMLLFFKTLFKGENFCTLESERGANSISITILHFLTDFLKRYNLLLGSIYFCSSRGLFSKKICPKRTFPSDFVKLSSEILKYLFLAEKMVVRVLASQNDGKKQMALKCTEIIFFHVLLSR